MLYKNSRMDVITIITTVRIIAITVSSILVDSKFKSPMIKISKLLGKSLDQEYIYRNIS